LHDRGLVTFAFDEQSKALYFRIDQEAVKALLRSATQVGNDAGTCHPALQVTCNAPSQVTCNAPLHTPVTQHDTTCNAASHLRVQSEENKRAAVADSPAAEVEGAAASLAFGERGLTPPAPPQPASSED